MPKNAPLALPTHGAATLPSVVVESYNLEIEDDEGFVGDKASKSAFWEIVDRWRQSLKDLGEDPFGDAPSGEIGKKQLEALLIEGDPKAAGLVQSAVEEFAQQLAKVIKRFLRVKAWRDVECIAIGGGFRSSRLGELAVARCALLLNAEEVPVSLELIENDPHDAGLLGAAHLLPAWMLKGYEGILAVDIGGTNIRAGLLELNLRKSADLSKATVAHVDVWRHSDEDLKRKEAVEGLTDMLQKLVVAAKKDGRRLAPLVGIGCPGIIDADGSIARGAQNLPGNWESSKFNLPRAIQEAVPEIGEHETIVVMHNDAVVQGLSELPRMQDRKRWAVLTIGTGLGNASFANRAPQKERG
jgi:predicted NBD/HSP70 family sugar kinase